MHGPRRNVKSTTLARKIVLFCLLCFTAAGHSPQNRLKAEEPKQPIKVGMIGLDTSHVVLFTKLLNHPQAADMAGVKVVAAYPGGSDDLPLSHDRVKGFTDQLRDRGVEIVDSIEHLLPKVDAIMLESVDGRCHLAQAKLVIQAGKPIFIDKPAAASLADVIEIFRLARERNVPCFSTSSNRFASDVQAVHRGQGKVGQVRGCDVYGVSQTIPHHPELYFYDIHGLEMLHAMMGAGCQSVACVKTPCAVHIACVWKDGRVATYRGIRANAGASGFGATVFGTEGIQQIGVGDEDELFAGELVSFFKTGQPPVNADHTIEIFALMDAAEESSRQGGAPVAIDKILEKVRAEK
jgi:predicted dehydrogenase